MPGTNLTRDEARDRAALLDVESYTVDLDLDPSRTTTFGSTTVIRFSSRQSGASTFADLVGATIHELTLNGRRLDPAEVYADGRIRLDGLEAANELRVVADCGYSHTGEGLHRFVDPADGRIYLYSQMEVPDARRVFTTFEQPDLKSVFAFTVRAPEQWKVGLERRDPEPRARGRRPGHLAVPGDRADVDVRHRDRGRRVPRGPRHLRRQARRDPAGALLPPVDGPLLRHRRAASR